MRFLHVVPTYLPAIAYGGPIVSVHGLCRALAKRGHHVEVFTTNRDRSGVSPVPVGVPVLRDGVRIRYFSSPILKRLFWAPALGVALRREVENFHAVHIHAVFLWPNWAAARAAHRAKVPFVISPKGMLVKELIKQRNPLIKSAWIQLIEKSNLRRASAIHVSSAVEAEELKRFGWSLPGLTIIPNGVDDPTTFDESQVSRDTRRVAQASQLVLFLGRISWKKGLDRLIKALADAQHAVVAIVGPDDENLVPQLSRIAEQLGFRDRVSFLPRIVLGADKEYLFAKARVCVLPSHSENFGNSVLEAMRRGVPVVVTPQVGAADIVREAAGGLVAEPGDFGEAIAKLVQDEALARSLGEAGQRYVTKHCSWAAAAEQMEALYAGLTPSNAGCA